MSNITRTSKRRDPTGLLNKSLIETTELSVIYRLAPKSEFSTITASIINVSGQDITFQLYVSDKPTPSLVDIIEPGILLKPNQVFIRTGLVMSYGEALFLKASQRPLS